MEKKSPELVGKAELNQKIAKVKNKLKVLLSEKALEKEKKDYFLRNYIKIASKIKSVRNIYFGTKPNNKELAKYEYSKKDEFEFFPDFVEIIKPEFKLYKRIFSYQSTILELENELEKLENIILKYLPTCKVSR